jgi:hypothetical protein
MITQEQINELDKSWDQEEGFLGQIRQGKFNEKLYAEYLNLLRSINIGEDECIPKHAITCLWYVPSFIDYWEHLVCRNYPQEKYRKMKEDVLNELERIFDFP